ncbi:hypothetical protein SAMN05444365_111107 [Micromonospora pattaloongensis]|uniref:DUF3054 domain-containing protein n=1 Tax=Micromonospora pattaloongensis TaxID=405436 RepID=A0A1H3SF56_9ACTN|nr:hypothetical protein [Micromonospora pattaloongensis]SDZ36636.1 hypothetical protein SAMN05444365_111107 [Micromonospora pattaloongensis]
MTEAKSDSFPRRDADGRVVALPDLLGVTLAGLVIGLAVLAVFDAGLSVVGAGRFGDANGWLAVILPVWLFAEEFRAWRIGPARIAVALVAAAVAIAAGLLGAGLTNGLPPLAAGGVGATVFSLVYALVWFHGVRWLAQRS